MKNILSGFGLVGLLAAGSSQSWAVETSHDPRAFVKPPAISRGHRPTLSRPPSRPSQSVETSDAVSRTALPALGTTSLFVPKATTSAAPTALVPPVTVSYAGRSPVFLIQNTGTDKGVESVTSNSKNVTSALYGETNGSGAGVNGVNTGTVGPAGKFQLRDTQSAQSAIVATSVGTGNAIYAEITSNSNVEGAAIVAENASKADTAGPAIDALADGNGDGIWGSSYGGSAVVGTSTLGVGIFAETYMGSSAIYAVSDDSTAIQAESTYSNALSASSDQGVAINAFSTSSGAIYGESEGLYGIWGQARDGVGVMGKDSGGGSGIYGASASGYAGYFDGPVNVVGTLTVNGVLISSDRNLKSDFKNVDTRDVLERIGDLPITSWGYKTNPENRHLGPMAQDFHAAFGLDGDDDTHINLVDAAGVSLAAIQELTKEMKVKDAQILEMKAQLAAQAAMLDTMRSMADQAQARMSALERHVANNGGDGGGGR